MRPPWGRDGGSIWGLRSTTLLVAWDHNGLFLRLPQRSLLFLASWSWAEPSYSKWQVLGTWNLKSSLRRDTILVGVVQVTLEGFHLLLCTPLCNFLLVSMGWTSWYSYNNRTWLKWWGVTFVIRLQETVGFILLTDMLYHPLSCGLWWQSVEEASVVRISGLPFSNSQRNTETLSPATCKELIPANNHMSMDGNTSPVKPSDESPALANTLIVVL